MSKSRAIKKKGYTGEVEVYKWLYSICERVASANNLALIDEVALFERNRIQTGFGGSDIKNPFGLAIEVKRQESLRVGVWWAQVTTSAKRTGERPVLLYRQNNKKWTAQIEAFFDDALHVVSLSEAEFEKWFANLVFANLHLNIFKSK